MTTPATQTPFSLDALRQQIAYFPRALLVVWQAAPRLTGLWILILLVQGLLPVALVYQTRTAVDALANVMDNSNSATVTATVTAMGLLAGILVLIELLRGLSSWVQVAQAEYVTDHVKQLIQQQAVTLDLSYYDDPTYYDMLYRAQNDASTMPLSLVQNIGRLLQHTITIIAIMGVLLPYGVWIPFALLLGALPAVGVILRIHWQMHKWLYENTYQQRRTNYYDRLLSRRQFAAEIRLHRLGALFMERFQSLRAKLKAEKLGIARREASAEFFAGFLNLLTIGGTLAILTWQTIQNGGSLGDLALFYQAFTQGQKLTSTLLGNVAQIYRNLLFIENLFRFLELEPRNGTPLEAVTTGESIDFQHTIAFKNITFNYPHSDRAALRDFSLTISRGQVVAIVGENGAGKSTLVNLLTRLYEPTQGSILIDGRDVRDLPLLAYQRLFAVLFQTPIRYQESASENIALGDIFADPSHSDVQTAAEQAGVASIIEKLTDGYDTLLGRQFGGAALSVGEWQRIALARAFTRNAPIVVLDEPTSAMDSWAETDWLLRFRNFVVDKTAVIITHRFTTAMIADVIYVMVAGELVECGSHSTLLAQNGHYAAAWSAQMRGVERKAAQSD